MYKILGVIAEYNPLHNGHLYHIEESKKIVNPDFTVCVLGGNFTQRGNTSLIDKWSKTEIALECGVDMVIELPTMYSISSAENFAQGAIKILNSLKCDTTLSFGSETGDLSILDKITDILYKEPPEYKSILEHELSTGISFPKARENAILMYLNDIRKYANVLSGPNNILGIEYLKAIKQLKSSIKPITIKRKGSNYHSLDEVEGFASATAIRDMLHKQYDVQDLLPSESYRILSENLKYGKWVPDLSLFEKEIIYTLRTISLSEIADLQDVSEGLENRIKNAANSCNNLEDLINSIKTKRYTRSRITRILLYALLDITKKDILESYKIKPYIRVLGMKKSAKELLSYISKRNLHNTVITSVKDFKDKNKNKVLNDMLERDILATDIYTLGYEYDSKANLDYTKKLIIQ